MRRRRVETGLRKSKHKRGLFETECRVLKESIMKFVMKSISLDLKLKDHALKLREEEKTHPIELIRSIIWSNCCLPAHVTQQQPPLELNHSFTHQKRSPFCASVKFELNRRRVHLSTSWPCRLALEAAVTPLTCPFAQLRGEQLPIPQDPDPEAWEQPVEQPQRQGGHSEGADPEERCLGPAERLLGVHPLHGCGDSAWCVRVCVETSMF